MVFRVLASKRISGKASPLVEQRPSQQVETLELLEQT
jgi:hypothetical protein